MATAGLYDDSGKWLFATGLPGEERRRRRPHRGVPGQVRHRRDLAAARQGRQQRASAEGDRRHLECARRQSVGVEGALDRTYFYQGDDQSDAKTDVDFGRGRAVERCRRGAGREGRAQRHRRLGLQRRRERFGRLSCGSTPRTRSRGALASASWSTRTSRSAACSTCSPPRTRWAAAREAPSTWGDVSIYTYHGYVAFNCGASRRRRFGPTSWSGWRHPLRHLLHRPGRSTRDRRRVAVLDHLGAGPQGVPRGGNFGIRLGVRSTPTYIKSDSAGGWCDPYWGCYIVADAQSPNQWEFNGGITLRF